MRKQRANSGSFKAGNPGRPKGSQNRLTKGAKEALQLAFEGIGGVDALVAWAKKNPTPFYQLYARLIPTEHEVIAPRAFETVHKILLVPGTFRADHPALLEGGDASQRVQ